MRHDEEEEDDSSSSSSSSSEDEDDQEEETQHAKQVCIYTMCLLSSYVSYTPVPQINIKSGNHVCSSFNENPFSVIVIGFTSLILPNWWQNEGKKYPLFQGFQQQDFQTPLFNDSYNSIKSKAYKHYFVSAVLPDDPVSLIGVNYNTFLLILNENASKIMFPWSGINVCQRMQAEDWSTKSVKYPFLKILWRQMLGIPIFFLILQSLMTVKNMPHFLEI